MSNLLTPAVCGQAICGKTVCGKTEVDALQVVAPPNKMTYLVGQTLNLTGLNVVKVKTDGSRETISNTSITTEPSTSVALKETHENLVLKYDGVVFAKLPITVKANMGWSSFAYTKTIEKRTKKTTATTWSAWSTSTDPLNMGDTIVAMETTAGTTMTQYRTVLQLNASALNVTLKEKKGIKLLVYKGGSDICYDRGHIIVNGIRQYIYGQRTYAVLNCGAIKSIIENGNRIIIEPDGIMFAFISGSSGTQIPKWKFERLISEGFKYETKDFDLTAGAKAKLDLVTGETAIVLPDIIGENTLLGLGVSHIFRYSAEDFGLGHRFRLNLHQSLKKTDELSGLIQCYEYEDAFGNKRSYYNYFYYIDDEGENQYFALEKLEERIINDNGILWDTENNRQVYYSKKRYNFEVRDDLVYNETGAIQYFRDICAQTENEYLIPIVFQKTNQMIRGFNCDGNLVWINDMYGNFVSIQYNNRGNRIEKVVDGYNNTLQFSYDNIQRLSYIQDNHGNRIKYTYSGAMQFYRLSSISHVKVDSNGTEGNAYKTYDITYEQTSGEPSLAYVITGIESSDKESCVLEYDEKLTSITKYSTVDKVPNGSTFSQTEDSIISKYTVQCSAQPYQTTITDENGDREIFRFDDKKLRSEYYQEFNRLVTKAERYKYVPFESKQVEKADRRYLNKVAFESYGFVAKEVEKTTLAIYDTPLLTVIDSIPITSTSSKQVTIQYGYDEDLRCTIERTTEEYSNGKTIVHVKRHSYDATTSALLQTVSYVEGEEATTGLTAEEYVYDDKGHITTTKRYKKTCSTNNPSSSEYIFDSSSATTIFYTQQTYNTQGIVGSEKDETGLYTTSYQYVSGKKLVESVTTPNGNSIEYAYDIEDRVTEMSGTSNGIENVNYMNYHSGELVELNHGINSDYINYEYEKKRRLSAVKFGTSVYETINYDDKVSFNNAIVNKASLTNAKGEVFTAIIDRAGRFEKSYYKATMSANDTPLLEKGYDAYGQLTSIIDHLSGEMVTINYDTVGQMTAYTSNGVSTCSETYTYNYRGNLQRLVSTGVVSRTDVFTYNSNSQGNLTQITTGSFTCELGYDIYNRYKSETISVNGTTVDTKTVEYRKEDAHGTSMVSQLQYRNGTRLAYTYDSMGNIATVKKNDVLVAKYTYDGLNRLVREDNQELNGTYLYTYDGNGNILSKETFAYTTGSVTSGIGTVQSYFYNNRDQLQSYNGQTFAYDAVGNPTTYKGQALTWNRGRKLVNFNGTTFTYDAQGKRIRKNSTNYYYNSAGQLLKSSDGMEYFYGNNGVMGFIHSGNQYIYRKNLQGDVVEILDSDGNSVVQYIYNAWGNHIVNANVGFEAIAQINPFRYRCYFYDVETGLYMIGTRYYAPEFGRFLQPTAVSNINANVINGINLYAYSINDPMGIYYSTAENSNEIVLGQMVGNNTINNVILQNIKIPSWLEILSTAIDHSFSIINPIRSALMCLRYTNLWELMRMDGVQELPGALANITKGVGYGLSIVGGILSGVEKGLSGGSIGASIAWGLTSSVVNIGFMHISAAAASGLMGVLAASTTIPGGLIIVGGAVVAIGVGVGLSHLYTKVEIAGKTIEEYLEDFVDWIVFWD